MERQIGALGLHKSRNLHPSVVQGEKMESRTPSARLLEKDFLTRGAREVAADIFIASLQDFFCALEDCALSLGVSLWSQEIY